MTQATRVSDRLYSVRCANCMRPLLLPFIPRTAKVCERCYAPRHHEEVAHQEVRKWFREVTQAVT